MFCCGLLLFLTLISPFSSSRYDTKDLVFKRTVYNGVPNNFTNHLYSQMVEMNDFDYFSHAMRLLRPSGLVAEDEVADYSTKIIVALSYNGEDIVKWHIEYLAPVVDYFIITEAMETHSGNAKDYLYFEQKSELFLPFLRKIHFIVIEKFPASHKHRQDIATRLGLGPHRETDSWEREEYQRDIVAEYLKVHFAETKYLLSVVDADEIIDRDILRQMKLYYNDLVLPMFFGMELFFYNFNWVYPSKWNAAYVVNDRCVEDGQFSLSQMRSLRSGNTLSSAGWHCSYCMSIEDMARKIGSFGHTDLDRSTNRDTLRIQSYVSRGLLFFEDDHVILDDNRTGAVVNISALDPVLQRFHEELLECSGVQQTASVEP